MEELSIKQMETTIRDVLLADSEESYKTYQMLISHFGRDNQSVSLFYNLFITAYGSGLEAATDSAIKLLKD